MNRRQPRSFKTQSGMVRAIDNFHLNEYEYIERTVNEDGEERLQPTFQVYDAVTYSRIKAFGFAAILVD